MTTQATFEQDRAWSIPIDGQQVAFATYDPVALALSVIYTDGSTTLVNNLGLQTTNQIISSANREAAVLAIVANG